MTERFRAPARTRPPVQLPRLAALRWYAVLIIFACNLNTVIGWRPLHIFSFGSTGGAFFFLLSGFVLTYSMPHRLNERDFYVARFARIYPSALVITSVAAALAAAWSNAPVTTGARELLASILLLHAWLPGSYSHSYAATTWALSVLALCYATFPFVVTALRSWRRQIRAIAAVVMLGVSALVGLVLARRGHADLAFTLPILRFAEFFAGAVIGMRVRRGWRVRIPISLAIVVVVGAAVIARRVTQQPMPDYVMVLPYALLMLAAANADLRGANGAVGATITGLPGPTGLRVLPRAATGLGVARPIAGLGPLMGFGDRDRPDRCHVGCKHRRGICTSSRHRGSVRRVGEAPAIRTNPFAGPIGQTKWRSRDERGR